MASTELRAAAKQALEALQNCANGEDDVLLTRDALAALRAALTEDALQKFTDVSQEIEAALAEPVQEPVAFAHINGTSDTKWHPPQRKPLTEEEIRDLWSWAMTAEAERTATTQQHAFARAIERAHGIGS